MDWERSPFSKVENVNGRSNLCPFQNTLHRLHFGSVSGEIFGDNWSNFYCFQVQLVTCCDRSVFLQQFEVYSTNSSILMGNSPEVSTSYVSNSTRSSVTSGWFSLFISLAQKIKMQ